MYDDYIVIIVPRRRLTADEIHERYHPNFGGIMKSIEKRLSMLEGANLSDIALIEKWIREGRYFDELTESEQQKWLDYTHGGSVAYAGARIRELFYNIGLEREEDVEPPPEGGFFHFKITRRQRPPTEEEFKQRVAEVHAFFERASAEYNSPEAVKKREAEYEEMHRIGALRKAAFERGEPMDKYPLPWEKAYKNDK